ncbi:hypothetical protein B0H13DRAFT_1858870 [Mycena leptocephala]|nr:hypothetical protein B0H13DRAFT_1858870 [Mycena leptocephala]
MISGVCIFSKGLQIHAPNLPETSRFPPLAATSGTPRFTLSPSARVLVATKSRPAAAPHLIHTDRVSVNQALEALDVQMAQREDDFPFLVPATVITAKKTSNSFVGPTNETHRRGAVTPRQNRMLVHFSATSVPSYKPRMCKATARKRSTRLMAHFVALASSFAEEPVHPLHPTPTTHSPFLVDGWTEIFLAGLGLEYYGKCRGVHYKVVGALRWACGDVRRRLRVCGVATIRWGDVAMGTVVGVGGVWIRLRYPESSL